MDIKTYIFTILFFCKITTKIFINLIRQSINIFTQLINHYRNLSNLFRVIQPIFMVKSKKDIRYIVSFY